MHLFIFCFIVPPIKGFLRLFGDMTELVLDVPSAYATLSKFMDKGVKAGFVTPEVYEEMPQR